MTTEQTTEQTTVEELARCVKILMDEREIREVLTRYVHGCDRLDEEELRSVYLEDAFDDHGPLRGPVSEFIPNVLASLTEEYTLCSHTLGQSRIEFLDDDHAFVETYLIAAVGRTLPDGEVLDINGGRYIDRMERVDGAWMIADRKFVPDYDVRIPRVRWQNPEEWTVGRRDKTDASYHR